MAGLTFFRHCEVSLGKRVAGVLSEDEGESCVTSMGRIDRMHECPGGLF
jgi:hypothetical protein